MKIEIAKYIREPVNNIVENSTLESLGESEENYQNKVETTNRCEALKYSNIFKMCPISKYLLVACCTSPCRPTKYLKYQIYT